MKQFQIDYARLHAMTKALQDAHLMVAKESIDKSIPVLIDYGAGKSELVHTQERLETIFAALPSPVPQSDSSH
jgi:hypothetical protein